MPEIHLADAGDQGDEGADDRNETRQDDARLPWRSKKMWVLIT